MKAFEEKNARNPFADRKSKTNSTQVYVEGNASTSSYQDAEGKTVNGFNVVQRSSSKPSFKPITTDQCTRLA